MLGMEPVMIFLWSAETTEIEVERKALSQISGER